MKEKRSKSEVRLHSMLRDHSAGKSARNDSSYRARSRDNSRYPVEDSFVQQKYTKYQFQSPEALEIFEKYKDNLQRIFQYYCTFGEPMNNVRLKSIKFMKMLKEAELLQVFNSISILIINRPALENKEEITLSESWIMSEFMKMLRTEP